MFYNWGPPLSTNRAQADHNTTTKRAQTRAQNKHKPPTKLPQSPPEPTNTPLKYYNTPAERGYYSIWRGIGGFWWLWGCFVGGLCLSCALVCARLLCAWLVVGLCLICAQWPDPVLDQCSAPRGAGPQGRVALPHCQGYARIHPARADAEG